jgi:ligand-binding SRPBCC domain-containing protein
MATYRRRTRIDAPLAAVWAFHSRINGLEALTPGWMGLRVEGVVGPDGDPDPTELVEGSEISMASRPFGIAPESRWLSRIVARERDAGYRMFRDDMLGGPFALWVHTHEFYGDGDETVLIDTVEYEVPAGAVGPLVDRLAVVGFEPMFRYRHRQTKALLEGGSMPDWLPALDDADTAPAVARPE